MCAADVGWSLGLLTILLSFSNHLRLFQGLIAAEMVLKHVSRFKQQ
jgi:hypothetical protein